VDDPLSRRCLQLAGLLSVLLIAVFVNYLLHGGGDELNPVAEAAQRTAAMPGARLKMEITYSVEGSSRSFVATGDGVYNARTGRTDAQLTMSIPGGESMWIEALGDDRTVYTRSTALESVLPPGKLWLGMEPLLGHDPQDALGTGPGTQGTIEMLKAAGGDVESLDHQIVSGHRTTRYKATIDPSHVAAIFAEQGEATLAKEYEELAERAPDSIPVEVWVDDHGLARLIRMVQQLPTVSGGPTLTMDSRIEFSDFGIHPKVPLPPRHRVLDYTPVLRAELGLMDGAIFGPLRPPAGAEPLSPATFRRRAGAICRRANGEANARLHEEHRLTRPFKSLDRSAVEAGEAKPLLRAMGRWIEGPIYRLGRRAILRLAALAPPRRYASDYRRYLRLDAQAAEWALAEARAYQLGAFKVPGADADRFKAQEGQRKSERKRLVATLGIPVCEKDPEGAGSAGEPA
jgi:hypothetical protein